MREEALGGTGRITPQRGRIDLFEGQGFIKGIRDGFVEFEYHGWHQELVRRRLTPADVRWACELLAGLTAVASTMTSPAPPTARLPRCTRCQSVGMPSGLEYMHIGETKILFLKRILRNVRGSNSLLTKVLFFP